MYGRLLLCVLALFAIALADDHHEGAVEDQLETISKNNTEIWNYIALFRNAVEKHLKEMSRRIQNVENQVAHMNDGHHQQGHAQEESHSDDHHHHDDNHDSEHQTSSSSSHGDDDHHHSHTSSSHDDHHDDSSHDDHGSSSHDDHHEGSSHGDHHGSSSHDDHHGGSSHDDHHGGSSHEEGHSHDDSHHHSHEAVDDQQKEHHGDHHGNHEDSHHANQQVSSHSHHHHRDSYHNHEPSSTQESTAQKEVSEPMMSSVHHKHHHNHHDHQKVGSHDHKLPNKTTKLPEAEEYDQYDFGQCAMGPNSDLDANIQQNIRGEVTFWQKKTGGPMGVHIRLRGFRVHSHGDHGQHRFRRSGYQASKVSHRHGFHVHATNDLSRSCNSLGPHYNPKGTDHGAPNSEVRHIGDLGNIECDNRGYTNLVFTDSVASLQGSESILDRGLIIHADVDDFGKKKDDPESLRTGNAGTRVACCIIEIVPRPSNDAVKYAQWAPEYRNDL